VAGDLQRKGYVGKTIGIKLRYDDFKTLDAPRATTAGLCLTGWCAELGG
jgi:DNA polymerase-4